MKHKPPRSAASTAPLLVVENLKIATAGEAPKVLVSGSSFVLHAGKTLALVGESGSGKTLTALAVMGLLPGELTVTAKTLALDGRDLVKMPKGELRALRGRDVAMIFQEPASALNPVMTCGAQVAETFKIHTPELGGKERKARVLKLFAQVQLSDPERIFASYPHQISGGQRQRVMIAMALAHGPKLLIADEPTTALDVTVQKEILELVRALQKDMGMAMLWVTHDFGVVRELADDVAVMQDGKIVETGSMNQVLDKPVHPYTKKLLAATLTLRTKALEGPKVAKPLLQADSLSLSYPMAGGLPWKKKSFAALKDVSLRVAAGRTLGVVGESGSGKSTLANALTQLVAPDKGTVVFLGSELTTAKGSELRRLRKDLQMVFQDPAASLNPKLTVGESVADGARAHKIVPEKEMRAYVSGLLAQCGLPKDAYDRYPHQFSGGQKQRVAIARALALKPQLIIADEAVSALDVSVQAQILKLFEDLQREHGLAMLFITHDLRVVSHLAHDILVMNRGEVVEFGPTYQVFAKPKEEYTKRLLAAVLD